jgi:Holin of 3TMs, for gene-transfer release
MAYDPLSTVLDIGGKLIDRLWPDPAQRDAAKLELLKMQQSGDLAMITGQMEVNKEEAKSASVFVSGWRPFIGWVCGMACAWNWIGLPVVKAGLLVAGHSLDLRPADLTEMLPVLMGMLGLGGLRTIEKLNGQARV